MVYVDTSCLLKLFRPEPLSGAVRDFLGEQDSVIVSTLAELETLVQLKGLWKAGIVTRGEWRQAEARFSILRNQPPFDFRAVPAPIFKTALRQHRNSGQQHCRSLDRLHLAAMEELRISRLVTHDEAQAEAAIEAGFEVVRPGRH